MDARKWVEYAAQVGCGLLVLIAVNAIGALCVIGLITLLGG